MKRKIKETRGITLIALIITVIIMLMLVIVGMNVLTSEEGLYTKTQETVDIYNDVMQNESDVMSLLTETIDEYYSINYVDFSIMGNNEYLKMMDSNGHVYISEERIILEESSYKNTGIKLRKIDNFIGSQFISDGYYGVDFVLDNYGKLYQFNEESNFFDMLFEGKEFENQYRYIEDGLYILGKDGDIYRIYLDEITKVMFDDDIKFKEIKYDMALSIDNSLYSIAYGSKYTGSYIVKAHNGNFFIDQNGDLYNIRNLSNINTSGVKFSHISQFSNKFCVDIDGNLYEYNRYSSTVEPTYKSGAIPLKESEVKKIYITGSILLKEGRFTYNGELDSNSFLSESGLTIKDYVDGCIVASNNDIYMFDEEIANYVKVNEDVKCKKCYEWIERMGNLCLSTDNELYTVSLNGLTKISNNDKIKSVNESILYCWRGFFAINSKSEIIYGLSYIELQ